MKIGIKLNCINKQKWNNAESGIWWKNYMISCNNIQLKPPKTR